MVFQKFHVIESHDQIRYRSYIIVHINANDNKGRDFLLVKSKFLQEHPTCIRFSSRSFFSKNETRNNLSKCFRLEKNRLLFIVALPYNLTYQSCRGHLILLMDILRLKLSVNHWWGRFELVQLSRLIDSTFYQIIYRTMNMTNNSI